MAEHVLRGSVGVIPRAEGGRHFLVQEDNGDFYRIPLPPQLHDQVAQALAMSEEELEGEVERQHAAAKLVLPGVNGHPSNN
jgi:hypothetical protein